MVNHAGKVVAPTAESFLAAAASAIGPTRRISAHHPPTRREKVWPVAGSTSS